MSSLTRPRLREPVALLDENGRPLEATRRLVAHPNPRGMQTYNSHPAAGLTVENIVSYYRSAELGAPTRQCDLFDDLIERLPEMESMFGERNDDIAGCDFAIVPPPDRNDKPSKMAAAALEEHLQHTVSTYMPGSKSKCTSTNFRAWLEHQGTNVPFGYACTNMMWDYVDGLVVPVQFEPIAARRFGAPSADRANEIWLIDGSQGSFKVIELDAGLWSITRRTHRNPWASGKMRGCAWWAFFALTGFKQWQIFADMFGLPLAIGYYEEGAGKRSREKLEEAVRSIGQDGYAVLSALTELVIKETARGGDGSTVYPLIFETALQQIRKGITGGSLNTDTGSTGVGSYNAATVHESRAYKMKRRDATRLEDEFADSIGRWFNIWNGFDRAGVPRLKLKIARDELARAQTIEILGMAMPISKSQMREEFNLRMPVDKEDEMTFTPTEPPDPNRQRPRK
jgi:phage gp29-like protein